MKQTAVEWLEDRILQVPDKVWEDLFEQAKEMEKQQQGYSEENIKKAYCDGSNLDYSIMISTKEGSEMLNKWFEQFKKA
ncbi:hypothetical protein UFOVP54_223 [uncultured Caudovirales phage]|uniref:Uncharacterized protein n=1 Tax=uncultured Caudovirales phage TaxID=2100421 RepID=A0A6J5KTH0_9CAUD|nr:hypothetical protein UFOVP54_223 [uncultured Caudovirales phage]